MRTRSVQVGDVELSIAEAGEGPLVLLVHGWPESWYVWRHQLGALSEAGYFAVAPDMRGFGGSDKPAELESYDIHNNCRDLIGVMDATGKQTAVLVGSDVGANIVWNCALLHPDRWLLWLGVIADVGFTAGFFALVRSDIQALPLLLQVFSRQESHQYSPGVQTRQVCASASHKSGLEHISTAAQPLLVSGSGSKASWPTAAAGRAATCTSA